MNKVLVLSATLLATILVRPVWGDGVLEPVHGGRMVEAAGHRLELVTNQDRVDLYVTDHGNKPVVVDRASGKVIFLAGQEKKDIALAPAGDNRLTGNGKIPAGGQVAVVITVEGLAKRITARLPAGQH
ncbi:MAG: hypothetical protein H7833_13975 [Magnetococcus sp. DMHC-1]|nr:hypothetical protein [Magnetococcales bacterium]